MKYPTEIKDQIYTNVIGDRTFSPAQYWDSDVRDTGPYQAVCLTPSSCTTDSFSPSIFDSYENMFQAAVRTDLRFMRTCRQMYVDARSILYRTNEFSFAEPSHFLRWLYSPGRTFRVQTLRTISIRLPGTLTRSHVAKLSSFSNVMTEMVKLRSVEIRFEINPSDLITICSGPEGLPGDSRKTTLVQVLTIMLGFRAPALESFKFIITHDNLESDGSGINWTDFIDPGKFEECKKDWTQTIEDVVLRRSASL